MTGAIGEMYCDLTDAACRWTQDRMGGKPGLDQGPVPMTAGPGPPGSRCRLARRAGAPVQMLAGLLDSEPTSSNHFVSMRNSESSVDRLRVLRALASEPRLLVLDWLRDPAANFPPQVDGDLVVDGVCSDHIREKLGVAAATASRHLTLLTDADLLIATRRKGWTFYRRNQPAIRGFLDEITRSL
jgi:DNA-binding transcriptional ArsR family regulator